MRENLTPSDRFWAKVDRNGPIPLHDPTLGPCWIWQGARVRDGYGRFKFGDRIRVASVVAYILTTGHEPPAEMPVIAHLCDGGAIGCVRPSHLKADTHAGNAADKVTRGRQAKGSKMASLGIRNGRARLTENQVIEMRRLHADERVSYAALGRAFCVSDAHAQRIIERKMWRHLDA